MFEFLTHLFDTTGFPPRWYCGPWTDGHGWLHILSDLGIWSAYLAIPCVLGYFILRRKDIPFRTIFLLFGAFILACGTTHLMEAIIFWWPAYRLAGVIKLLTAIVSWATVIALVPVVPQVLAMRSPDELEREVAARKLADDALQQANAELERRVEERTAELAQAHDALLAANRLKDELLGGLRDSEEKFRLLADTIPQLAWMARSDGHLFWYNRRWYEFTGTTPEAMMGWGWKSVQDPVRLPEVIDRWRASLASGEPFEMVFPLKGADGQFRSFLTRVQPLRGDDGRIVYWFGTNTDITDMTQMQAALRAAEERSRFLAQASAALAALVDYESTLQSVARLAVPFFADWCAVDMIDASGTVRRLAVAHVDPRKVRLAHELSERFPPDSDAAPGIRTILRTGQAEFVPEVSDATLAKSIRDPELLRITRELGLRSYIGVPLKVRDTTLGVLTFIVAESDRRYGPHDLAVAEDLAHRASVAIENARLYRELKESDKRKDVFLATLAHELRNPLAPIKNSVFILNRIGLDNPQVRKARDVIERQVNQMTRLVDDLLDISRISRGKIELRKQPVLLADIVSGAVETSRPLLDERRHELTVELPADPVTLDADPTRLEQALANLLNNSAKYTEQGGRISIAVERDGDSIEIRVRDSGIGIDADALPTVFEMFIQGDHAKDRAQGGLGIGLSLVRSLVQMHGGSVEARSDGPGTGSEFIIRLPASTTSERGAIATSALPSKAMPSRPNHRVLVVDDNIDAAESLALLLRLAGHQVNVAHNGQDAIDAVSANCFDLIFLDIGLPGMNGYEVAQEIRKLPYGERVLLLALTGWGQDEDRRRSKVAGFDQHLVKPIDAATLEGLIGKMTVDMPK